MNIKIRTHVYQLVMKQMQLNRKNKQENASMHCTKHLKKNKHPNCSQGDSLISSQGLMSFPAWRAILALL